MHRNLWIKLAKIWGQVGGGQLAAGGRDPPVAGLAGATVAALNTYKKKIFKKVTTNANCAKMSTSQTTREPYENEAGNSHNQGPRVDRLRH
jgi:hypothetical protein